MILVSGLVWPHNILALVGLPLAQLLVGQANHSILCLFSERNWAGLVSLCRAVMEQNSKDGSVSGKVLASTLGDLDLTFSWTEKQIKAPKLFYFHSLVGWFPFLLICCFACYSDWYQHCPIAFRDSLKTVSGGAFLQQHRTGSYCLTSEDSWDSQTALH